MRRTSLGFQVFLSILGVSLGTTLIVGLFARSALSTAFDAYLSSLPQPRPGMMGRGRMMLGAAEQAFVASVDRSVLIAAIAAGVLGAVVALLLAAYLAKPLRRLEEAAEEIADGDFAHRVDVAGPTEVASLGDAFNRMADSLEEAEELRRRMVADVAHELRNPLAAARAQAEGMADGVIAADDARLGSLVEDLQHLTVLVNDLQELAVAEAGRLRYEMVPLDLAMLARREAARAEAQLRSGVVLAVEAPDEPAMVLGDEHRLSQVLRNILSNAARHTMAGGVTVSVSLAVETVTVTVADTGDGMSADDVDRIFDRFYRADSARAADTGGSGLGLAISRAIVRDHGGDVFATSELGTGSTVGFTLPRTSV